MKERRYDIDWLRVLVMLAVFFFHCAMFFGGPAWYLKNATESVLAWVFVGWLDMWFMPLFFLLSGSSSWYALRSRSNGQYVLERVRRLLVPLYTVGLFLILPLEAYFNAFTNTGYRGTFWESLPAYFSELGHFSLDRPGNLLPVPFPAYMWFLQYLFLTSLLTFPLLRYLRSERGRHLIDTLARWCHRRGGMFLILIPVVLVRISLQSFFVGLYTWADFVEFILFFVIGYIMAADTRFTESMKKYGWICLGLGFVSFIVFVYFVFGLGYKYLGDEPFSLRFVLFETVRGIGRWSWILFVLGVGAKYLNVNSRVLAYGSEAVLPFYILHHPIILSVGWFVIRWNAGILSKYLIIAGASFALIMVLYELLIRRFNVARFFFGMRPREKLPVTSALRTQV